MKLRLLLAISAAAMALGQARAQYPYPTFSASPVSTTWQATNLNTLSGAAIPNGT